LYDARGFYFPAVFQLFSFSTRPLKSCTTTTSSWRANVTDGAAKKKTVTIVVRARDISKTPPVGEYKRVVFSRGQTTRRRYDTHAQYTEAAAAGGGSRFFYREFISDGFRIFPLGTVNNIARKR